MPSRRAGPEAGSWRPASPVGRRSPTGRPKHLLEVGGCRSWSTSWPRLACTVELEHAERGGAVGTGGCAGPERPSRWAPGSATSRAGPTRSAWCSTATCCPGTTSQAERRDPRDGDPSTCRCTSWRWGRRLAAATDVGTYRIAGSHVDRCRAGSEPRHPRRDASSGGPARLDVGSSTRRATRVRGALARRRHLVLAVARACRSPARRRRGRGRRRLRGRPGRARWSGSA